MSRSRTPLNTYGKVTVVPQGRTAEGRWVSSSPQAAERWKARTSYRHGNGESRDVTAFATTKAKAETMLKLKLTSLSTPTRGAGKIAATSTVREAGTHWLERDLTPSKRSENTKQQYRDTYSRCIENSVIANLTLIEANDVQTIEAWLQGIADERGSASAKTARTVLSQVLSMAVRYRAVPHNVTKDVRPAKAATKRASRRDPERAFTETERAHVIEVTDAHAEAKAADVADVLAFLSGTGVRINEALALRWEDLDLTTARARIHGTKTESSNRTLTLPAWLAERLAQRQRGASPYVFPSPGLLNATKPRDTRNVHRVIRKILDEAGYEWATSHTFRHTAATLLLEAGEPLHLVAGHLGHANPMMTARHYLHRQPHTQEVGAGL
jgi:integrase